MGYVHPHHEHIEMAYAVMFGLLALGLTLILTMLKACAAT